MRVVYASKQRVVDDAEYRNYYMIMELGCHGISHYLLFDVHFML